MALSKDGLIALFNRKDEIGMHAVGRALLVLYRNQTDFEQRTHSTHNHNNMGFTPGDAKKGTGMAEFYKRAGFLTPKQLAYWAEADRTASGRPRIQKYWRQILEAAEAKEAAKLALESKESAAA